VNYRVLTVSREFGSGGGRIARIVAEKLGWKLLDGELIDAIAATAHVDPRVVSSYDEHVESWLRRMNRQAMRASALAGGVIPEAEKPFDPDVAAELQRQIIEQAYADGNCVIVGRGSQCILQKQCDVYHVFIYAPFKERVKRLRTRLEPGAKIEQRIHTVDGERALYLRQRFGREWNDLHLYDLMISSSEDEERTARVIVNAMTGNC
jgi:CMP/dCMP kinase